MRYLYISFLLILMWLPAQVFGQSDTNLLIETNASNAVTLCGDTVSFTITITNSSSDIVSGINFQTEFPEGISLTNSQYTNTGTTTSPVFAIPDIPTDSNTSFTYEVKGDCSVLNGFNDSTGDETEFNVANVNTIDYLIGGIQESFSGTSESYNIRFAELEAKVSDDDVNVFFGVLEKDTNGTVFNREIEVRNSGLGALSSFTFYVDIDNRITYNALTVNGITLTPDGTTTSPLNPDFDRVTYTINDFTSIGDNNALFEQNEIMTFIDNVALFPGDCYSAALETNYTVNWGCNDTVCNESDQEAITTNYIKFVEGRPSLRSVPTNLGVLDSGSLCGDQIVLGEYIINNGYGNSPVEADTAFDIRIRDAYYKDVTITIAGINFPNDSSTGNDYIADLDNNPLLTTDPDGQGIGLEDIDKDGFYDDLPVGNSIAFQVQYNGAWIPDTYTANESFSNFSLTPKGNSCQSYVGSYGIGSFRYSLRASSTEQFEAPSELSSGDTATIIFNGGKRIDQQPYNPYPFNFGGYYAEVKLPIGYEVVSANRYSTELSFEKVNDFYRIYDANAYSPITLEIKVNCIESAAPEIGEIEWNTFLDACGDYTTLEPISITTKSRSIFTNYNDCSGNGGGGGGLCDFTTTSFNFERNTFGFEEPAPDTNGVQYYTNQQLQTAPRVDKNTTGVALDRGYPLDNILINSEGVLSESDTPSTPDTFDTLYFEFAYQRLNEGDTGLFEHQVDGTLTIDGSSFILTNPEIIISGERITYLYTVEGVSISNATEKTINVSDLELKLKSRSQLGLERGTYPLEILRGRFFGENTSGIISCSKSFGDDFFLFMPLLEAYTYNGGYLCDLILDTPGRITLGSATKADDFPNEYRPMIIYDKYTVEPPRDDFQIREGYPYTIYTRQNETIANESHRFLTLNDDNLTPGTDYTFENHIAPDIEGIDLDREITIAFDPICDEDFVIPNNYKIQNLFQLYYIDPYESQEPLMLENTTGLYLDFDVPFEVNSNITQEGFEESVEWPVSICSEETINNSWVAVELKENDNRTNLIGARNQDDILPVVFYGEINPNTGLGKNMLIKVGLVSRDICETIYPIASYSSCENDATQNMEIITSWSCDTYPLDGLSAAELESITSIKDPGLLSCLFRMDEQELTLRYKTGGISWEVNRLDENVDLCEGASYEVKVVSSKFANVYDADVTIDLPQGISFEDINAISYAFDGQTGVVNTTDFVEVNGSSYTIKAAELVTDLLVMAGVSGIESGDNTIPGTRLPGKNEITFTMDFIADCTMDPGIPIKFNLDGLTNCGDIVNYAFNRLFPLNNIVLPNLSMDVNASDFLQCNTQNQLTIDVTNNDPLTVDNQVLEVVLPSGTSFGGAVDGFPAPDQSGNTLSWNLNDLNTNKNQTFQIYTILTDFEQTGFEYNASLIQTGTGVCATNQQTCNLDVTSAYGSGTASQIALPELNIEPVSSVPVCSGENMVVNVVLEGITDYSGYNFSWNVTPVASNANQFTFDLDDSTNLMVTVSPNGNNNGNCSGSVSYMADVYPGADLTMTLVQGVSCSGQADGAVNFSVMGESGSGFTEQEPFKVIAVSSSGSLTVGQELTSGTNVEVRNLPEGIFSVTLEDNYGCTFIKTINVPRIGSPISNFCTTLLPCGITTGDIDLSFQTSTSHTTISGTAYSAQIIDTQSGLSISDFTGIFPDSQAQTLTAMEKGSIYRLEITAANGCIYTRNFIINSYNVNAAITNDNSDPGFYELCYANETRDVVITVSDNIPSCSVFSVTGYDVTFGMIDNEGAYIGSPQTLNNVRGDLEFPGLGEGKYKAEVLPTGPANYPGDIGLCGDELTFEIKQRAQFTAEVKTTDPSCYGTATGSAEAIIFGGSGNFEYQWKQDGGTEILSTSHTLTGMPAGNYQVVVSDMNGCPNPIPLSFTLVDPDPLDIPFIEDVQTACDAIAGLESGGTAVGYSSGVAPYEFSWFAIDSITSNKGTLSISESLVYKEIVEEGGVSSYMGISPGDYKVIVKDAKGCEVESLVTTITQPDVTRQYNICLSWSSPVIKETEPTTPQSIVRSPIDPSSFKQAITAHVEQCIVEAQAVTQSSIERALTDIELLKDTLSLTYTQNPTENYHFTLYYYDRAGNLVRTVPPEGVVIATDGSGNIARVPTSHTYVTGYDYNSIAQLEKQNTPDGGTTNFLYNDIGQLWYSQNARQQSEGTFSYSKYDNLGRIIEAGEAKLSGKIFPYDFLNDGQADSTVASNIVTEDKAEYIATTFNEKAEVTYQGNEQRYLRNRVSYIYNLDKNGGVSKTYYSYDPHGNVEWIVQEVPGIRQTTVAYSYDLISGNVNQVIFNKGRVDEYHHKYEYDADNRIVNVQTSKDGHLWDKDASYDYYLHGPLARTELGEDKVQGLDFTYTIHGWLKGINTPNLAQNDYSPDGNDILDGAGNGAPKDEFGMALGYYEGDFTREGVFDSRLTAANPFALENQVAGVPQNLYNGNISTWISQTKAEAEERGTSSFLVGNSYRYDQLNRIKAATTKAFNEASQAYENIAGEADAFASNYTYDGNGNLQSLKRYTEDGQLMDDLTYHYDLTDPNLSNKLTHVNDAVGQLDPIINDLPSQAIGNYQYDETGQLVRDESEGLTYIWNTSGKVSEIIPDYTGDTETQRVHLKFTYDGLGNRIVKQVNRMPYDTSGNGPEIQNPEAVETTYYSLDAQGNVMGVYKREDEKMFPEDPTDKTYRAVFSLIERPIYGSDRIGQDIHKEEVFKTEYTFEGDNDFAGVMLEFKENINKVAYGNILLAQRASKVVQDTLGNPITIVGTKLATSVVDKSMVSLEYQPQLLSDSTLVAAQSGNNIFQIETREEQLLGYGLVTNNYLGGEEDKPVMLVYDQQGQLIDGLDLINADTSSKPDPQAKSIVIQSPSNASEFVLLYRTVNGSLSKAILTTTGNTLQLTDVTTLPFSNYGRHMAVVEDRKNTKYFVYGTMHAGAVVDTTGVIVTPPQANLVRFNVVASDSIVAEGAVTESFNSYNIKGDGELQIALDGSAISMYNATDFASQWTEAANAEVRTWKLDKETWLPIENDIYTHTIGENVGKGSLVNTGDEIYFTQFDQSTTAVKRASDMSVINTSLGDIRANKNEKLYQFAQTMNVGEEWNLAGSSTLTLNNLPIGEGTTGYQPYQPFTVKSMLQNDNNGLVYRYAGEKYYELKDHLGNVRVVVSDRKDLITTDNTLSAHVESYNNYYPFGMLQPNRTFNNPTYRYGFQGQEKDDELKGAGNSINYMFRMYDSRLGKFLSLDPLSVQYPHNSPFAFAENRVIDGIELEGAEYLDADETLIHFIKGTAFIKLENFSDVFQEQYMKDYPYFGFYKINQTTGLAYGYGQISNFTPPNPLDEAPQAMATKEDDNPSGQSSYGRKRVNKDNSMDRRFTGRKASMTSGTGKMAGLAFVVNLFNGYQEFTHKKLISEDLSKYTEQTKSWATLDMFNNKWIQHESVLSKVTQDIKRATEGKNPIISNEQASNIDFMTGVTNIILFGGSGYEKKEVREAATQILKEISKNYDVNKDMGLKIETLKSKLNELNKLDSKREKDEK